MKRRRFLMTTVILVAMISSPLVADAENDDNCPESWNGNHSWRWIESQMIDEENHYEVFECTGCGGEKKEVNKHEYGRDRSYEEYDKDNHRVIYHCSCGASKDGGIETHSYDKTEYIIIDGEEHKEINTCECGATLSCTDPHYFDPFFPYYLNGDAQYIKIDDSYHGQAGLCRCGAIGTIDQERHAFESWNNPKKIDETYHTGYLWCSTCGMEKTRREKHKYDTLIPELDYSDYSKINGTYHGKVYACECGAKKVRDLKKHSWGKLNPEDVTEMATLTSLGRIEFLCSECSAKRNKYVRWKYGTYYSEDYDVIDHSNVYRKSKAITIKLQKPVKGAVAKVKIGKRTYKKKIRNNKRKVKIKIKKPKYGKKITIKLYYKGKLIGIDQCEDGEDWVLYGKKIKKGMTKKQVKYLYYWGLPNRKGSSSGGWSYWYYDDGSYIIFKNGKVRDWYNAG